MDKVFANFQLDVEFFILMSIFFAISLLITIIIVFFVTKINTLHRILEQAKEIDEVKIIKISILEAQIKEAKTESSGLGRELLFIQKNEERLKNALNSVDTLREELRGESKALTESMYRLKIDFNQLSIHYELLNNSYTKLEDSHNKLQDRNEILVKEKNQFRNQVRQKVSRSI